MFVLALTPRPPAQVPGRPRATACRIPPAVLGTRSFILSCIVHGAIATHQSIHPSSQPASRNQTGKESRSPHQRESSRSQACLRPACVCRQLPAYSPITFQAVRAEGCEPFGCFEHFVRHPQPAHAHRETHSTSDRTAQICQYPLSASPRPPCNAPQGPKDTKNTERES